MEAKIRGTTLGVIRSREKLQSEDGTLNRPIIVLVTNESILRSKKRRNSGDSEGSVQGSPSRYGLRIPQPADFQFLTFERRQDHWHLNVIYFCLIRTGMEIGVSLTHKKVMTKGKRRHISSVYS